MDEYTVILVGGFEGFPPQRQVQVRPWIVIQAANLGACQIRKIPELDADLGDRCRCYKASYIVDGVDREQKILVVNCIYSTHHRIARPRGEDLIVSFAIL